jgi:transcriptional regulator with XRE-family HTH domain
MTTNGSPTLHRRRLGRELRKLRDAAGRTMDEVAEHLECSTAKISRIENGHSPVLGRDVRDMVELYSAPTGVREALVELAKATKRQGWWHRYADAMPDYFPTFVGMEADAASERVYSPSLVPGLLQTPSYARELMLADIDADPKQVERALELRMERQKRLTDPDKPLFLQVILDEAVLNRPVGGGRIMLEQLAHLAEMAHRPNVQIYVISTGAGAYPGMNTPFIVLNFAEEDDEGIVYLEQQASALYVEAPEDVARYKLIVEKMREIAYGWRESAELLESMSDGS